MSWNEKPTVAAQQAFNGLNVKHFKFWIEEAELTKRLNFILKHSHYFQHFVQKHNYYLVTVAAYLENW